MESLGELMLEADSVLLCSISEKIAGYCWRLGLIMCLCLGKTRSNHPGYIDSPTVCGKVTVNLQGGLGPPGVLQVKWPGGT
jgi:hypothetical protein